MKFKLSLLLALAVALVATTVTSASADSVSTTSCAPGTTNPSYCETSNLPTAVVSFVNGVKIIHTPSGIIIDTGTKVKCHPNLPVNCGGSAVVTANVGNAARVVTIAHAGWHVKSGGTLQVKVRVVKKYEKLFNRLETLRLVIKVNHHGSPTGRKVTLTRHSTLKLVDGASVR